MAQEKGQHERICVTSTGPTPEDLVDPRFGRCTYFIIFEGAGGTHRAVENDARGLGNGAGIQAAQTIAKLDVNILLTGDVGPNAFRVLTAAGIKVYRTGNVRVREALSEYMKRKLLEISTPGWPGHHGGQGFGYGSRRGAGWNDQ